MRLGLCLFLTLLLISSCSFKVKTQKVLLKSPSVNEVRTFSPAELPKGHVRFATLTYIQNLQNRWGFPVRFSYLLRKWSYRSKKAGIGIGEPPKYGYPAFLNVCWDKEVLGGKEVWNCSKICYLEGPTKGSCLDLGFIPYSVGGTEFVENEFITSKFFFNEPWIDAYRGELVFLRGNELCRWRYFEGELKCRALKGVPDLVNPSLFLTGMPDQIILLSNPTRCIYEENSSGVVEFAECDIKNRPICVYSERHGLATCIDIPVYLDVFNVLPMTARESLLITDKAIFKVDFLSRELKEVMKGYALVRYRSCDYENFTCSYLLKTFPPGYLYVVGGNIYKDVVLSSATDLLFGSEFETVVRRKVLLDEPVVMSTLLVKCERGGVVWRFLGETLKMFERTLPPELLGIEDFRKVLNRIRLGLEVSERLSKVIVSFKNRKEIDIESLKDLLKKSVKDEKVYSAVISAAYYASLFDRDITIKMGDKCDTPYYLKTSLIDLKTGSVLENNRISLPFEMTSSALNYAFHLLPFKLGNRYFLLLVTHTDPIVDADGLRFKVIYVLISADGRLLSYGEEEHTLPVIPVNCPRTDLPETVSRLMTYPEEIKISPSGEIKVGMCTLETGDLGAFKRALSEIPRSFRLDTWEGLKVLEVVRVGGRKEILDLYFRRIDLNIAVSSRER